MNQRTLIVIPTYDEKENVRPMAAAVLAQDPELNILFVDDRSPDGTGEILDEMAKADTRIFVLHREAKEGLGRAYIAGFKWALARDYQLICEMDCDFSHDPAALPSLLREANRGTDLVLGSRYIGGIRVMNWPMNRLLLSTGAAQYVKLVTGMPVCDPTGGFKCFHREVLEAIDLDKITSNGYSFQIEMSHSAWMRGFSIKEVPIIFEDRRAGYSKMKANIATEAFIMVLKLWIRSGFRRSPKKKEPPKKTP
ncbi:MAG: polyprenol monophosphomannose synthase [Kiritimatiellae bacterium]|nr:polyprenol monophosphomannose synthase [Kiritimatiellia bacterium]